MKLLTKRRSLWKIIVLLACFVILLMVCNMFLLVQLKTVETKEKSEIDKVLLEMKDSVSNSHRLDASGTYNVIANLLQSSSVYRNKDANSENITIATQCSSNHLHNLLDLTQAFRGPISVTVFTYDSDVKYSIQLIAFYHFCYELIQRQVTFHLVYPVSRRPPDRNQEQYWTMSVDCETSPEYFLNQNYAIQGIEYPQNLLRNVAIKYSRTTHIMLTDVDLIPSRNLQSVFQNIQQRYAFLKKSTFISRNVYVVPVFELQDGHKIPKDKRELLQMWDSGFIRPFYVEECWRCQKDTDYNRWRKIQPEQILTYNVEWGDPWEPFYISTKSVPKFDERFKQYGFNRVSQICEMYVAGYQFTVLSDVFLVHKGFKFPSSFHSTMHEEHRKNRLLFRKFKKELVEKYEESERQC